MIDNTEGAQSNTNELLQVQFSRYSIQNRPGPTDREISKALVEDIMDIFCGVALKQLNKKYKVMRENEWSLYLGKACSYCHLKCRGPYYKCIDCMEQYILCTNCQMMEQVHLRDHVFAKIKRPEQQRIQDIPYQDYSAYHNIPGESDEVIQEHLLDKFRNLQQRLLERSTMESFNPVNTRSSTQAEKRQLESQGSFMQSQIESEFKRNLQSSNHHQNQEKEQQRYREQQR